MSLQHFHNFIAKIRPFATTAVLFATTMVPRIVRAAEQVQTVDVDLGQIQAETIVTEKAATVDPQLMFLFGLTVVGMIGIVGLVKDFRRGH
jgi:hypothetical protein